MLPFRRFNVALSLVLLAVLMLAPAFFFGMWVGILFSLVPLFAAVVIILKPGPRP